MQSPEGLENTPFTQDGSGTKEKSHSEINPPLNPHRHVQNRKLTILNDLELIPSRCSMRFWHNHLELIVV